MPQVLHVYNSMSVYNPAPATSCRLHITPHLSYKVLLPKSEDPPTSLSSTSDISTDSRKVASYEKREGAETDPGTHLDICTALRMRTPSTCSVRLSHFMKVTVSPVSFIIERCILFFAETIVVAIVEVFDISIGLQRFIECYAF